MADRTNTLWEWLGKAALIIGILWGVTKLYGAIFAPTAKLSAVAERWSNEVRPDSSGRLSEVFHAALKDRVLHADLTNQVPSPLMGFYESQLNRLLMESEGDVWTVEVVNRGNKQCNGVVLKLPRLKIGKLVRDGRAPIVLTNEIADVGMMQPMEGIRVVYWGDSLLSSPDTPTLTHSEGIGKVSLRGSVPPFWFWLSRFWVSTMISLCMLVVVALLFLPLIRPILRKITKTESPTGNNKALDDATVPRIGPPED